MDDVNAFIKRQLKKYNVKYSTVVIDGNTITISIKGNRSDYKKFINTLYRNHIKLKSCTYGCWRFMLDD